MKQRLFGLILALAAAFSSGKAMTETTVHEESFGALADGRAITRYTLRNARGASASFMPLGAAVLSVEAPDRNGALADVVLGFDTAADYAADNSPQFGLTIGRYAGRIAGTTHRTTGEVVTFDLSGRPVAVHVPALGVIAVQRL